MTTLTINRWNGQTHISVDYVGGKRSTPSLSDEIGRMPLTEREARMGIYLLKLRYRKFIEQAERNVA